MNQRGEDLAATVIAAVTRSMGVTKAAGMPAGTVPLPVLEAVVRGMAEIIGEFDEHVSYVGTVLKAMAAPVPEHQFAPYRPQEWRTGLIPNVPPRHANGHDYAREQ